MPPRTNSGHSLSRFSVPLLPKPLFLGYVGRGLASGVAVGNVFSSPSVGQIAAATRGVDSGKGVLYLYGNYSRASLRGYCSTPVAGQPGFLAAGTQQGAA
jgi:Dak1 domain